jgi:hypothetical protein
MSTPNETSIDVPTIPIPPIMFSTQDSSPSGSNTDPPDKESTINSPGDFEYVFKYNYTEEEEETLRKIALIYQDEFNRTIFESKDALKTRLEDVGRRFGVYVSTTAGRVFSCNRFGDPNSSDAETVNRLYLANAPCDVLSTTPFRHTPIQKIP